MRTAVLIDGKTLREIAEENGLSLNTVQHRYLRGERTYEKLSRSANRRGRSVMQIYYTSEQGSRLRDIFLQSDMSFADLSRKSGVRETTIKSFLYYGTDITSVRLAKLCEALNASMDYVMGLKENNK